MLAEFLATSGQRLLSRTPPEGRAYWAARYWDRDALEAHPVLGPHYVRQRATIAGYLSEHGAHAENVLEFGCGTGAFTVLAAERTTARDILAVDISEHAIARARTRVGARANVRFRQADFWSADGIEPADVVMCVDAIHHLGAVRDVLVRLRSFARPGGVLIGNLSIADNWAEFGRERYGAAGHLARTLSFFGTSVLIRASGGRLRTASYRTQLLRCDMVRRILTEEFSEILDLDEHRYLTSFACRV